MVGWAERLSTHLTNLTPPSGSLVGRAEDLSALRSRIVDEPTRLLTLTGPAGTGKTRLAIAAAIQQIDAFPDGVWFVDLAPARQPDAVLRAIAQAIGLHGAATDLPLHSSLPLYIADKRMLLVIDNCEHILEVAPALAELLDMCPQLRMLATSREPLRVRRERVQPVGPLPTPDSGQTDVGTVASVQLFVERARDIQPGFALTADIEAAVAELCRRLDGLPLALELAAARTRVLPPHAILARLASRFDLLRGGRRDDPERHQTLWAALAWSHDLLNHNEKLVFRRLAPFSGGCTLDGAEEVCDPDHTLDATVLDLLEGLLDKNLLKQEEAAAEPRFVMLETIRAFAQVELEASGEAEPVRARQAAYIANVVAQARLELRGPRQMAWLTRLDREIGNIGAALHFLTSRAEARDADSVQLGLGLGADLWWYMHTRGTYADTRALLIPLVEASEPSPPTAVRGRALSTLGVAAWGLGDFATALREVRQSLAIANAVNDEPGACQAMLNLVCVTISMGDMETARSATAEALSRSRLLGDEWMEAWALTFQGMLDLARNDPDRAAANFEAALRVRHRLGDLFGEAWATNGLASVAMLRGDAVRAQPLFERALSIFRPLGERPTVATIRHGLAQVASARGDLALARQRFEETLVLYREMDSRRGIGIVLQELAGLAAEEGRPEMALRLSGAAMAAYEAGGGAIELIRRGSDDWLASARQRLGAAHADAAWQAGRALPLEQAVAEALTTSMRKRTVERAAERAADMPLTAREREVVRLIALGATNRQIAESLVIGERTAEAHVSNMLAKLGLSTRVQLAAWAVARGLASEVSVA